MKPRALLFALVFAGAACAGAATHDQPSVPVPATQVATSPAPKPICEPVSLEQVGLRDEALPVKFRIPRASRDCFDYKSCEEQCPAEPAACREWGERITGGSAEDERIAVSAWEQACEGGDLDGCRRAGYAYLDGEHVTRDLAKATQLLQTGCQAGSGSPTACTLLGFLYATEANPVDPVRAAEAYRHGCDGGHPHACHYLGLRTLDGVGVTADEDAGLSMLKRACGDPGGRQNGACHDLGHALADRAESVEGRCIADRVQQFGCEGGDRLACIDWASAVRFGTLVPRDIQKARSLWHAGCDEHGFVEACFRLGDSYLRDAEAKLDGNAATRYLTQACDEESIGACTMMGEALSTGMAGLPESPARAFAFFEKGCALDGSAACLYLAEAYRYGKGTQENDEEAVALVRRLCEGDGAFAGTGCHWLGRMHEDGEGVKKDDAAAAEHYERGCKLGSEPSCAALATLYFEGRGVRQDLERAAALYRASCPSGGVGRSGWGCMRSGSDALYGVAAKREEIEAAGYFMSACYEGYAPGCFHVGLAYAFGFADSPADLKKANEWFSRAMEASKDGCESGSPHSCWSLAVQRLRGWGTKRDASAAKTAFASARRGFQKSCHEGKADGCVNLGFMHQVGLDEPVDYAQAARMARRACDLDEAVGCGNLAWLHEHGLGVAKDSTRARKLYQRACKSTGGYSCAALGLEAERKGKKQCARQLYERACRLGASAGCARVHSLDSQGGQAGCAEDPTACWVRAADALMGNGMDASLDEARRQANEACRAGEWRACDMLMDLGDLPERSESGP